MKSRNIRRRANQPCNARDSATHSPAQNRQPTPPLPARDVLARNNYWTGNINEVY